MPATQGLNAKAKKVILQGRHFEAHAWIESALHPCLLSHHVPTSIPGIAPNFLLVKEYQFRCELKKTQNSRVMHPFAIFTTQRSSVFGDPNSNLERVGNIIL